MFTGLVERTGKVVEVTSTTATAPTRFWIDVGSGYDARHGDSIAVNGCCLTVVEMRGSHYAFDVSRETLACTAFGKDFGGGSVVNLERALKVGDRLGGHLVSGHVDGTATVELLEQEVGGWLFRVRLLPAMARFVIDKGSVCIDGVSLTINRVKDDAGVTTIEMMLIPATVEMTNLSLRKSGDSINIELDMMAKFAARQRL